MNDAGALALPDLPRDCEGPVFAEPWQAQAFLPCDREGPLFGEPWQAQAFAMTLALHERGVFTWAEWAAALAARIEAAQAAGDPDRGDTYWQHWLGALETMVDAKRAGSEVELARLRRAWDRAAHRTPHGQAIVLAADDFDD